MSSRFTKATHIQEVILKSNRLSKMPHDSKLLAKLDRGIKGIIGGQLADHCQIGKIEDNILIYYVDSPLWAYTFRMSKASIIATLQSISSSAPKDGSVEASEMRLLHTIEDIQIRVRPQIARPAVFRKTRKPLPRLSELTAKSIEETAETFNDQELAQLWREFGRKHSK